MSYVMVSFVFNDLRLEMIVCFVYISGIVDQHCLKLSFHNSKLGRNVPWISLYKVHIFMFN